MQSAKRQSFKSLKSLKPLACTCCLSNVAQYPEHCAPLWSRDHHRGSSQHPGTVSQVFLLMPMKTKPRRTRRAQRWNFSKGCERMILHVFVLFVYFVVQIQPFQCKIWLRKSFVRSCWGFSKNSTGIFSSRISPSSINKTLCAALLAKPIS
jgi:hypothetical protein